MSGPAGGAPVLNPPLTFVIDTTKSVKPDKNSIFNLTQTVVDRIKDTNTNIPRYQLITVRTEWTIINNPILKIGRSAKGQLISKCPFDITKSTKKSAKSL